MPFHCYTVPTSHAVNETTSSSSQSVAVDNVTPRGRQSNDRRVPGGDEMSTEGSHTSKSIDQQRNTVSQTDNTIIIIVALYFVSKIIQ